MSELLPCPFCGGEAELTGFNAPEYWVWCPNCKASTDAHTGKENAIEVWNTRAGYFCQFSRSDYEDGCALMGELKMAKRNGVKLIPERTCHFIPYADRGKYDDDGVCSECEELMYETDNYCHNCGARVIP